MLKGWRVWRGDEEGIAGPEKAARRPVPPSVVMTRSHIACIRDPRS